MLDPLLAAVRIAPRRYRLPPLPADLAAAGAAAPDAALAFAIDAARRGEDSDALRDLFTTTLAQVVRNALSDTDGDPAFQALVARRRHAHVDEHARLAAQVHADRRTIRTAVDAFAHPGKLPSENSGTVLGGLHAQARAGEWAVLRDALESLPAHEQAAAVASSPALARLERGAALLEQESVQAYLALRNQHGPEARTPGAALSGRASTRVGDAAESETLHVFLRIAALLSDPLDAPHHRAAGGLRTPPGYPGEAGKAKDEWDAAILRRPGPGSPWQLALLAEVKASPAAATPDYSRLLRGLERLAMADPGVAYDFPALGGAIALCGASLRALQPDGRALPPQVIYCCPGLPETEPVLLTAATRAVLLAEPASIDYACRHEEGAAPEASALLPVWTALAREPRLRSALHQDETSRRAREAMLHPSDLLAAAVETLRTP